MARTAPSSSKLADRAYEQLKSMAVSYRLRPGERLAEVELARQLKVSRTPIREALNRLFTEGFLTFTPNRGFQARMLDAKEIFDLYEVRRTLEAGSARHAAERATDEEIEELARFLERSRAVPDDTSVLELVSLDEQFHEWVARLSRNTEILHILQNINERIRFCRWIDMEHGRRANTQREHADVLGALRARDAELSARVMEAHIARRLDQIVTVIREGYARIYMGDSLNRVARLPTRRRS